MRRSSAIYSPRRIYILAILLLVILISDSSPASAQTASTDPLSTSVCDNPSCTGNVGFDSSKCTGFSRSLQVLCPCRPGYIGFNCEACDARIAWAGDMISGQIGCTPCNCHDLGSSGKSCSRGVCTCKPGFAGDKCSECDVGFSANFPNCQRCKCNPSGSMSAANSTTPAATCVDFNGASQCKCKPGYTGEGCYTCAGNAYESSPGVCSTCDCIVENTLACEAATPGAASSTPSCQCRAGFGGTKCEQCANEFTNYPECRGNVFLQNKSVLIATAVAAVLIPILLALLRRKSPSDADILQPFMSLLSTIGLATALLFFRDRAQGSDLVLAIVTGVFTFVPWIASLALSSWMMHVEQRDSEAFRVWLKQNLALASAVALLGMSGVEMLMLLSCRVLGLGVFSAPWRETTLTKIQVRALFNIIFASLPLLVIQAIVLSRAGRDKKDLVTLANMCISVLLILFGVLQRVLLYQISKRDKAMLEKASPGVADSNNGGISRQVAATSNISNQKGWQQLDDQSGMRATLDATRRPYQKPPPRPPVPEHRPGGASHGDVRF